MTSFKHEKANESKEASIPRNTVARDTAAKRERINESMDDLDGATLLSLNSPRVPKKKKRVGSMKGMKEINASPDPVVVDWDQKAVRSFNFDMQDLPKAVEEKPFVAGCETDVSAQPIKHKEGVEEAFEYDDDDSNIFTNDSDEDDAELSDAGAKLFDAEIEHTAGIGPDELHMWHSSVPRHLNRVGGVLKTTRNHSKPGRHLIKWNRPRMMEKLLLNLQYECHLSKITLPWANTVQRLSPGSNPDSALQFLNKIREPLIAEGHMIPPTMGKGHEYCQSVRGFARDMNGPSPTTTKVIRWGDEYDNRKENLEDHGMVRGSGLYRRAQMDGKKVVRTPKTMKDRGGRRNLIPEELLEEMKARKAEKRAGKDIQVATPKTNERRFKLRLRKSKVEPKSEEYANSAEESTDDEDGKIFKLIRDAKMDTGCDVTFSSPMNGGIEQLSEPATPSKELQSFEHTSDTGFVDAGSGTAFEMQAQSNACKDISDLNHKLFATIPESSYGMRGDLHEKIVDKDIVTTAENTNNGQTTEMSIRSEVELIAPSVHPLNILRRFGNADRNGLDHGHDRYHTGSDPKLLSEHRSQSQLRPSNHETDRDFSYQLRASMLSFEDDVAKEHSRGYSQKSDELDGEYQGLCTTQLIGDEDAAEEEIDVALNDHYGVPYEAAELLYDGQQTVQEVPDVEMRDFTPAQHDQTRHFIYVPGEIHDEGLQDDLPDFLTRYNSLSPSAEVMRQRATQQMYFRHYHDVNDENANRNPASGIELPENHFDDGGDGYIDLV